MATSAMLPQGRQRYYDNNGLPLAGGKLYTYAAGTSTPQPAYTDSAGTIPHTNPIILDAKGEAVIFWNGAYKVDLKAADDTQITGWPVDNIKSDPLGVVASFAAFVLSLASAAGAALIGFMQAGVGSVLRTLLDKTRERVTPEDYGMVAGDASAGVANSVAMNKLVAYATANGACIRVPKKTYYVAPNLAKTDEAGSNLAAIEMLSNLHIRADKGAVFKIPDGISSDAAPTRFSMFFSNQALSDISIVGLGFDMNGANNPISPSRGSGVYNLFTQAAILFSGTPGGVAARGDDVHIERCKFMNTAGVTSIGCMQSNSPGVTLGKRWKILFNTFINNGLDTNDHSSVYIWSNEVQLIGNTFTADTMQGTVGGTGGIAAWECHGANIVATGNTVKNYYRGCYVATNYTNDCKNVVIACNSMGPLRGTGVELERIQAGGMPVYNVNIAGNTIELTDDPVAISYKPAVLLNTIYEITDVNIHGNQVRKTGTVVASAMVGLAATSVAGQKATRIKISGNQATGMTLGVLLATNTTCGLGDITIANNRFFDLTAAGAFAMPTGISGANIDNTFVTAVDSLSIEGNSFIDTRAVPLAQYGIYLSGKISNLYVGPQTYVGNQLADYFETNIQVTARRGFYNAAAFTPTWKCGATPITMGASVSSGSYALLNDQITVTARLTVGAGAVFPAGVLNFDSPLTAKTAGLTYMGSWRLFDASASVNFVGAAKIDGAASAISLAYNSSPDVSGTVPVTLATGDVINVQITHTRI